MIVLQQEDSEPVRLNRGMLENMLSKKIVLSGASGMVGRAVRGALERAGAQTLQLVRKAPLGANQAYWDPAAPLPVHLPALDDATAAIHLSGANVAAQRWTASYKREMTASRVQTTRALCTALAELSRPPQVLLVASAVGIYGDRGDERLDETSAPGSGFLADLCQAWEQAAQPAVDAGIRVVHLRLGVVLGRGGALARMLPVFRVGLGGRLGSGRQWMSWIALEDVVGAVAFLLENEAMAGPVNLTSPQPVRNAEFTRALAGQLHRPAVFPAPALLLRLAFGQMAREALLAGAQVMPQKLVEAGYRFRQPEVGAALAAALDPHAGARG